MLKLINKKGVLSMKYAILVRQDDFSQMIMKQVVENIHLTPDFDNPDIVIVIGGDGTVLRAVKKYFSLIDKVVFFGINTGHLGFYSNWASSEVNSFIDCINREVYQEETFHLLEYSINGEEKSFAINEVTIRNNYVVDEFDVTIDHELFETFRGTGLCISTTNGSTALNKSLGGSVIDTSIEAFQISEMASVNSNAFRTLGSSAVFSGNRILEITKRDEGQIMITADQEVFERSFQKITVSLSKKKVKFALNKKASFWGRVRKSFI